MAIRVVHTLLVAPWPPGFFNDEAYYHTLAKIVADGHGFVRPAQLLGSHVAIPTAERAPLFTLVLAGLVKLGGTSADAQRLVGVVTGGGAILVVGLLARRLAGPRAGLIAAALAALYPTLIAADGALMTESMYGFFAVFALLAAYRVADGAGLRWAVALGAALGLASLARGEGLVLAVLLVVPLLLRPRARRAAAVAAGALALGVAPRAIPHRVPFH